MFLAIGVTAGSLSRALSNLRISIEGFEERQGAPVMLECVKDEARSLDGRYEFQPAREEATLKSRHWSGTDFTEFLQKISGTGSKEYVLFLVRPNGIDTFHVLRDVLVLRDDDLCTVTVALPAMLDAQDQNFLSGLSNNLKRKVLLRDKKIWFSGQMSPSERESLRQTLGAAFSAEVDSLFEKSQNSIPCVDHGVELVPAEWKFERDSQGQVSMRPGQP